MWIIAVIALIGVAVVALSKSTPQGSNNTTGDEPEPYEGVPSPNEDDGGGTAEPVDKLPEEKIDEGHVRVGGCGAYSETRLLTRGMPFSATIQVFYKGPERKVWCGIILGKSNGFSHQDPVSIPRERMFVQDVTLARSTQERMVEVTFNEEWPDCPPGKYDMLRVVAPRVVNPDAATLFVGGRYDDDWDDDVFNSVDPSNRVSVPEGAVYS